MNNLKNIVCIGGGTGTFVLLRGLKSYPVNLSAIVSMSDSGGSNKRIRDEFGMLPTSDIRQCFVALSDENGGAGLLRQLFMYRFDKGKGISGMTFGNLFLAALTDILGSQKEAIRQTSKVLRIKGTVIPVTYTNTDLRAVYEDGSELSEEHLIDEPPHDGTLAISRVFLKPNASANSEAIEAIQKANLVLLGPGDLFTSTIPNLVVSGIPQAIKKSKAKIIYVLNLMTKYGQTLGFTAMDHIKCLSTYLRSKPDYVLVNTSVIPSKAMALYAKSHEYPVVDDIPISTPFQVIPKSLASKILFEKTKSDTLVRSLIRHDSTMLAQTIMELL